MSSATEKALTALLLSLACASCGSDDAKADPAHERMSASQSGSCTSGDPKQPLEIDLVYRDVNGAMMPLAELADLPLIQPPQGGKVLLVGVRARNIEGCTLMLSTALRDAADNMIVSLERRPVSLEPDADGWLRPLQPMELSNYSNLPACPHANLTHSINGEPYVIEISATDAAGRNAKLTRKIVPTCAEPASLDLCLCECTKDYTLGGACGASPHPD
jgi:hypothetical protein